MKRTKKSAILSLCLIAALIITGAFAYMSDHDNAINKFSFTDEDGNQTIDIQLSETNWEEENGVDIQYGTPVAKNPVATNVGSNEMYAFATVILPAKGVVVQDKNGAMVGVDGQAITGADFAAKFDTKIINNVTAADEVTENDEIEILGVYKDSALAEKYEPNEIIDADRTDDAEVTVYFKLNADAAVDSFPAANLSTVYSTEPVADDPSTPEDETVAGVVDYYVLADTVDEDNYTSNILGHQFALKIVAKEGTQLEVRELYTLELDDNGSADRIIEGAWVHYDDVITAAADNAEAPYENAAGEVDGSASALDVYGRSTYNNGNGQWVEITDEVSQPTIYVDGAGRIYSAHVFYYTTPLAAGEATESLFDYVELINVVNGQILEEDDMNIYVETYGVQTTGISEDIVDDADTDVNNGAAIWEVLTNAEDQEGFDIFGAVKDTQDTIVAGYVANGQNVANDYAIVNP